jgi:hypothetical protein
MVSHDAREIIEKNRRWTDFLTDEVYAKVELTLIPV